MTIQKIKAGEIWSLAPAREGEDRPAPLVVIDGREDEWVALPLFNAGALASNKSIRLSDDPDWLEGESWCAADEPIRIYGIEQLGSRVDSIGSRTLQELRRFREKGTTNLVTGLPFLSGLGDPRDRTFRQLVEEIGDFAAYAQTRKVINIADFERPRGIRRILREMTAAAAAFATQGAFAALAKPFLAAAISAVAKLTGKPVDPVSAGEVLEHTTTVGKYMVAIYAVRTKDGWMQVLKIKADKVSIQVKGERRPLRQIKDFWLMERKDYLSEGKHIFRIEGEHGPADLEIDI